MKKLVLLISSCFLSSLFTVTSASAQTVVHVSMSNLTFVGASVCGGSTPCTERVNISFEWNVTTGSIVSGSMSPVDVSGAIAGPYSFANDGPVVGGQGFLWTDASGESVSVNTCGFDCGKFPSTGAYNTIDVNLLCGTPGDTCFTDSFNGGHPTNGTFTIGMTLIGVQNTITLTSDSVSQSANCPKVSLILPTTSCFSIQQNLVIDAPNGPVYWAQNAIIVANTLLHQYAAHEFQLYDILTGKPVETQSTSGNLFFLPQTWTITTQINSSDQLMVGGPFQNFTATTAMPAGAFITVGGKLPSSSAFSSNASLSPELILVGAGNGLSAAFGSSTTGSVQSFTKTRGEAWLTTVTLTARQSIDSLSFETSSGLGWAFTGSNTSVLGPSPGRLASAAEGVGFVPGTPVGAATVAGGQASVDEISSTGVSITIAGSGAPDGTKVTVTTANIGAIQPSGTGQVSLGPAGFYDVSVQGISDGTATVCISSISVTSQSLMQYWNNQTSQWQNATGLSTTNIPADTICGLIPVAALSGTAIAVGPLSNIQAQVDLETKVQSVARRRGKDRYLVTLAVTNNGSLTADDASVILAELNGTPTSTALPNPLGSLSYAASATFTLSFPRSAGEEEDFGYLRIVETYTGGSAEQIVRIALPDRDDQDDPDDNHPDH